VAPGRAGTFVDPLDRVHGKRERYHSVVPLPFRCFVRRD
jgi:hypothetical protein